MPSVRPSSHRYESQVALYGEAKRERFLRELAGLEDSVHLARTQAREQLDRYALQQAVGPGEAGGGRVSLPGLPTRVSPRLARACPSPGCPRVSLPG